MSSDLILSFGPTAHQKTFSYLVDTRHVYVLACLLEMGAYRGSIKAHMDSAQS